MSRRVGALLLTGGESSRMGTDKALLEARLGDGNAPLWQVLAGELERVAERGVLALGVDQHLGGAADGPPWSTVRDRASGAGPLVALDNALPALAWCDVVVVCAVDVALADAATFTVLLDALESSGREACLCDEPSRGLAAQVFAARRAPLAEAVTETLAAGQRSLRAAMGRLALECLPPSRLPDPAVLWPCNTPDEWERVRARLAARVPTR